MNELMMREIHAKKVKDSTYGKAFNETNSGQKLLDQGVSKMISYCKSSKLKTQGGRKLVSEVVEEFIDNGKLDGLAYAVIEYILNGLAITNELEGKDPKYRNIRLSTGNKLRKDILCLDDSEDNLLVAVQILEIGIESLSEYLEVQRENIGANNLIRYCLKEEYRKNIIETIENRCKSGFYALPTTNEPVPWKVSITEGVVNVEGGYNGVPTPIIRGGKLDMPNYSFNPSFLVENTKPIEALNRIQSVAFRVNRSSLKRIKGDLGDNPIKPVMPEEVKEYKKFRFDFFSEYPTKEDRLAAGVEVPAIPIPVLEYEAAAGAYKTEVGKLVSARLSVKIAEMVVDQPKIYFPHNFDYRGRMYPIASSLTPQGDDISKGLLEFAEGVELTDEGVEVCIAYLASVYGYDKEPYEKRLELGNDILFDDSINYLDAEEPYVFAQVRESIRDIINGVTDKCHLSIAIDGSCNGLQHMAAITMDKVGGEYVNVGGNTDRQDIYIEIANHSAKLINDDIDNNTDLDEDDIKTLKLLHSFMVGSKARKIAKRPVMINPYGGTFMGYKDYILQSLQEFYPEYSTNANAAKLTTFINRAMQEKLNGGKKYQDWVRKTFSSVAKLGVYPQFETPDGFRVSNYSFEVDMQQRSMQSLVSRNGKSILRSVSRSNDLNTRKIGTRAQPNIIHALDATHLRMTALGCIDEGITQLWFIHDSFATTPNDWHKLNKITREKFVELYNPDGGNHPIDCITNRLHHQVDKAGVLYKFNDFPMFEGDDRLELNDVLSNEYFFA